MKKDFLSIKDLSKKEIDEIFSLSSKLKKDKNKFSNKLKGKSIGLIFQKPSNRTRVSFEVGIHQLGGNCIYLSKDEINLGVREAIKDIALTLSRYLDGIVLRSFNHEHLLELARYATIPVINGLTDLLHPCQVLSDLYTIKEKFKRLNNLSLAYIGDGNNVCHSLLYGAAKTGLNLRIAAPEGYQPRRDIFEEAEKIALNTGAHLFLSDRPEEIVKDADIIYTDVWASMGQEDERQMRKKVFSGFQVNSKLISLAKKKCLVMHCLPAHRGEEITDDVIDSPNSIVFDQVENRLYVQKAILIKLVGDNK